jgi:hypothetical protein
LSVNVVGLKTSEKIESISFQIRGRSLNFIDAGYIARDDIIAFNVTDAEIPPGLAQRLSTLSGNPLK